MKPSRATLALSWSILAAPWGILDPLGRLGRISGPSWHALWLSWGVLWPSWGVLWPSLPPKSHRTADRKTLFFLCFFNTFALRSHPEANLLQHGPLHRPGAVLGASWGHLGASWPRLGPSCGVLGPPWPPKTLPKTIQNPSQNRSKNRSKIDAILDPPGEQKTL